MEIKNTFLETYEKMERWLYQPDLSPKMQRELSALENRLVENSGDKEAKEEIYDRFYKELDFGTGGIRGVLGAGTNRMNVYTVRRITQGFADYINRYHSEPSVAIAYDSRILSTRFALEASSVLAANKIKVYIYKELMPTPALSYAVRYYGCSGGIMITASHNPSRYNGYKIYNNEGCQVTLEATSEIQDCIEKVDLFNGPKTVNLNIDMDYLMEGSLNEDIEDSFLSIIPQSTVDAYINAVKERSVGISCSEVEVVYSPLNGTGNKPVRRVLEEIGVGKIHVVPEQEKPNGNFPTCPYPNPEKLEALTKGLALCKELGTPDILLATDPDCDRLGIAVRKFDQNTQKVEYKRLTGNEVAVILLDFICYNCTLPERPLAMKTIVSSKMVDEVAAHYGVEMIDVLTGFKFIGEHIGLLEKKGEENRFVFGFEESYGYLTGSYVRDKDAVNAAMLVCEAVAYYKKEDKTLLDRLRELYDKYGYYKNELVDFEFEGASGMEKMKEILNHLRANPPKQIIGRQVNEIADYLNSQRRVISKSCDMVAGFYPIDMPKAEVLEYVLDDGSSLIVRPSGTEPKLKIYLSAKSDSDEDSKLIIEEMKKIVKGWVTHE